MSIILQPTQYTRLDTFINEAKETLSKQAIKCADYVGILKEEYEDYAVIKIDGYYNITRIVDDYYPIEVSDIVYPFNEEKIYPMQKAIVELSYKNYY